MIVMVALVSLVTNNAQAQFLPFQGQTTATETQTPTKPIVFRMDDVQDYFAANGTIPTIDLFIQKKIPVLVGVEPEAIGNDTLVINKIKEGIKKGILEIGLHGSIDYRTASLEAQTAIMKRGDEKIQKMFGVHPTVFVPPMADFNNDTLRAMAANNMSIMSSALFAEESNNSTDEVFNKTLGCGDEHCNSPSHVSAVSMFKIVMANGSKALTNEQIEKSVADMMKKYGYSVILFHPQDFMKEKNGEIGRELDPVRFAQFKTLVDDLVQKYKPVKMGGIW
jgi:hypothetical protein